MLRAMSARGTGVAEGADDGGEAHEVLQGGDALHRRVQVPGAQRLGPHCGVPARASLRTRQMSQTLVPQKP